MKNNAYAPQETVTQKRMQIVYLRHAKSETWDRIAEITGYTIKTVKSYCSKFRDLLMVAYEYFTEEVKKISKKIVRKAEGFTYIIQFADYVKVGKTNCVERRFKELEKKYGEIVKVHKIFEFTGDDAEDDALTMENTCRKHFKHKEGAKFIPNDRFQNVTVEAEDLEILEKKLAFVI